MNVSAIGNLFGVQQGPEKIDRKPAAETAGSLAFGTAETLVLLQTTQVAHSAQWLRQSFQHRESTTIQSGWK